MPTVALTIVPAAREKSMTPSARTLPSGDAPRSRRRMSTVATSISSTLPVVCPSADPSGRVA